MRRLALVVLFAAACGRPGQAELAITLAHPDPTLLRSVLAERFRLAQTRATLNLTRSKVQVDPHGLTLDLGIATDGPCTDEAAAALLAQSSALATGAASLTIHRVDPAAAERLADALRAQGQDVRTPYDRPGLVLAPAPLPPAAPPEVAPAEVLRFGSELWVVEPTPALTSDDLLAVTPSDDRVGVELLVRPEKVAALAALTEARRPLPFVLDGVMIGAPALASRASEGRLRLDLPGEASDPKVHDLLARLAASPLATAPTITASRAACRP